MLSTTREISRSTEKSVEAAPAPAKRRASDAREMIETVIFVAVLVNLLRMFGAEAFVIPTGSMATTLMGAHKVARCPECGVDSYVNANDEVEYGRRVLSAVCQNCREPLDVAAIRPSGGDRVLVSKVLYAGAFEPERWEVVVFKCPDLNKSKINFIKRLVGKPNEIVRIRYGDIWTSPKAGEEFSIARKPAAVLLAQRRLVWDNDHPAKDLLALGFPQRWQPASGGAWEIGDSRRRFRPKGESAAWLEYRHIVGGDDREGGPEPQLITDFEAYNSSALRGGQHVNWVGDLMLEATLEIEALRGSATLELHEGERVYRCIFDLSGKRVVLDQNGTERDSRPSPIDAAGAWDVRFANFDDRLTVWVEGSLVFGDGVVVKPPTEDEAGPRPPDLLPARIGVDGGAVAVSGIRLYRDTYYTQTALSPDYLTDYPSRFPEQTLADWRRHLSDSPGKDFVVGADEFFMLGDNSPCSSDGREWERTHFVPRHMLLGRALFLYWPIGNWKFVR